MVLLTPALATAGLVLLSLCHPASSSGRSLDEFSGRVAENMIPCRCSPSSRRFSIPKVFDEPLHSYNDAVTDRKLPGVMPALHRHHHTAVVLFARCAAWFGYEACVNQDAELRRLRRITVCIFDRDSGRNLARSKLGDGFSELPPCDALARFRSPDRFLDDTLGVQRLPHWDPTTENSPTQRPAKSMIPDWFPHSRPWAQALPSRSTDGAAQASPTWRPAQSTQTDDWKVIPSGEPAPPANTDSQSGQPSIPLPSRVPIPLASLEATAQDRGVTEGCVAVEHLHGFALQHKKHLVRDVLCWDSFCATQNHALIVAGKWTSLKEICRTVSCSRNRKFVNNLDVFVNWRARVSKTVVVTPYDARFPHFVVWVAQLVERIFS